ncbi:hypothetical protein ABE65_020775 [Fictibacillus phosphorivorans]|uniref:Uncharacterized protein n=1 Tax=Fictibacillus phosphorivorans TaxID=1221500 RepID=A0A160IRR4_9BACL|nr:hypothetical protein [Fictibacillus phosphorivorans]ANC79106.1 hypothetical protein ABE65_020775 [Fictibacillus phosphorivorans]
MEKFTLKEWHRKQAVENFNKTWDMIEKKDRTKKEDVEMIHTAHASRFHWGQIGEPLHFARGEWQLSRVYALLNMSESALFHGKHSLELCLENNITDFDLAFAYEALARAYLVKDDETSMEEYFALALQASQQIMKKEDKEYFISELNSIKLGSRT